ncbi:hypothetical protein ACFC6L_11565 [Kitasatospora phosalacinea]|uniref:hypothetical protein n=1 Tax=Kitasatospora phosalacinea TaxID=2065 RepID=UPI0035E374F7
MAAVEASRGTAEVAPRRTPGSTLVRLLTTTDHETIGTTYLVTAFAFFLVGGVLSLLVPAG